jgi:hypothetical protein
MIRRTALHALIPTATGFALVDATTTSGNDHAVRLGPN